MSFDPNDLTETEKLPRPEDEGAHMTCKCGRSVQKTRLDYAIPTCYSCLPPPKPLTRVYFMNGKRVVDDIATARAHAAQRAEWDDIVDDVEVHVPDNIDEAK